MLPQHRAIPLMHEEGWLGAAHCAPQCVLDGVFVKNSLQELTHQEHVFASSVESTRTQEPRGLFEMLGETLDRNVQHFLKFYDHILEIYPRLWSHTHANKKFKIRRKWKATRETVFRRFSSEECWTIFSRYQHILWLEYFMQDLHAFLMELRDTNALIASFANRVSASPKATLPAASRSRRHTLTGRPQDLVVAPEVLLREKVRLVHSQVEMDGDAVRGVHIPMSADSGRRESMASPLTGVSTNPRISSPSNSPTLMAASWVRGGVEGAGSSPPFSSNSRRSRERELVRKHAQQAAILEGTAGSSTSPTTLSSSSPTDQARRPGPVFTPASQLVDTGHSADAPRTGFRPRGASQIVSEGPTF